MFKTKTILTVAIAILTSLAVTMPIYSQDDTGNGVVCPEKETSDFEFTWNSTYRLATYHGVCTDWIPWSNTAIAKQVPPQAALEGELLEVQSGSKRKGRKGTYAYDSFEGEWRYLGGGGDDDFWDYSIGPSRPGRWDYGFGIYDSIYD